MLARLLPEGFRAAVEWGDVAARLYPQEEEAVRGAVPSRRAEFTTGRHCARSALKALGMEPGSIPVGPGREPIWPTGVLGSVTHCAGYRAAAVGRCGGAVVALGIDAEPNGPLPSGVGPLVLGEGEGGPPVMIGDAWRDRLVFSAKESLFKAWWILEGRWLDFHDARVAVCEDGTVGFTLLIPRHHACSYKGRWGVVRGIVHTVVTALGG